jgi:hypothetical protein
MAQLLGLPLRVVRLTVPLPGIERRLAGDVTIGRRDDLREAASSIAAAEGAGVEDVVISNDRPIGGRRAGRADLPRMALGRRSRPVRASAHAAVGSQGPDGSRSDKLSGLPGLIIPVRSSSISSG